MQVFVPYKNVIDTAKAMWADSRRYNKAIIELKQIIAAIEGAKAWRNHPVCLMYKEHKDWLICYANCFTSYRDYMNTKDIKFLNQSVICSKNAELCEPKFLSLDDLILHHRKRLYSKSPDKYPQFAEYGTSDINYYVVDGELLKYVNGKRI